MDLQMDNDFITYIIQQVEKHDKIQTPIPQKISEQGNNGIPG